MKFNLRSTCLASVVRAGVTVALGVMLSWPLYGQVQKIKTTWVPLGSANGILLEPVTPELTKSHIGIIYTHLGANNLNNQTGPELSKRGYRVFLLNHYADNGIGFEAIAPLIARAVNYLRELTGIETVVLLGYSGGGPLMTFYQNVAENGPRVCQGPEKIYPCRGELEGLPKADGLILLDSHAGDAFKTLTYIDPAIDSTLQSTPRNPDLDMFSPQNGYDSATKAATYSDGFIKKFFAAQSARNEDIIDQALARLAKIEAGTGDYKDDEPFIVPGAEGGARLLQPDVRLLSYTKESHPLLHPDGTMPTRIAHSIRPPMGNTANVGSYEGGTEISSVRRFLASSALRTTSDYGMTENLLTGVDWASSNTSTPSNVEGITVPLLIMSMTCHYFVVTSEIIYDHAGSKDKRIVYVFGASHNFQPCRPEFGDTAKTVFDFIDLWLSAGNRYASKN